MATLWSDSDTEAFQRLDIPAADSLPSPSQPESPREAVPEKDRPKGWRGGRLLPWPWTSLASISQDQECPSKRGSIEACPNRPLHSDPLRHRALTATLVSSIKGRLTQAGSSSMPPFGPTNSSTFQRPEASSSSNKEPWSTVSVFKVGRSPIKLHTSISMPRRCARSHS